MNRMRNLKTNATNNEKECEEKAKDKYDPQNIHWEKW